MRFARLLISALLASLALPALAHAAPAATPAGASGYKLLKAEKVGGTGGFDYVYADSDGRKLYIPRSNRVDVFDLDSLQSAGSIPDARGVHGAVVDPASHHGFSSSSPVLMWDTQTLKTVKTIEVKGRPDGINIDPATHHVFILSHSQPNATVINAADGSIVDTLDLGGAPEQSAADGEGHLYIDLEDKNAIAVVDTRTNKLTATWPLGKAAAPAGLALDARNHILFIMCREPANCVIMSATDGKVLTTLSIGNGTDGGGFNPDTLEAFSSGGDGTLTFIKENSPADFTVAQTLKTMPGAKTCTLDAKTGRILLISAERETPASQPAAGAPAPARGRGGRGGRFLPDSFSILVVGK